MHTEVTLLYKLSLCTLAWFVFPVVSVPLIKACFRKRYSEYDQRRYLLGHHREGLVATTAKQNGA